jgi:hypothetical protein
MPWCMLRIPNNAVRLAGAFSSVLRPPKKTMMYFLRDDKLTARRREHTPAELIKSYETGRLHLDSFVVAKGECDWRRLDSTMRLLRLEAGTPKKRRL